MIPINYQCHLNNLDFKVAIMNIIGEYDIEEIIETGTNTGEGSTLYLADTGLDVHTIECNPEFYKKALENLKHVSNVMCHIGLSLKKKDMLEWLQNDKYDYPSDIMIDSRNPIDFYTKEINFDVPEDLLLPLVSNEKRQIVFLDSAGGVGYQEFLSIMKLSGKYKINKVLVLDDCLHVKHYRSVQFLEKEGYKVNKIMGGRLCWSKL